MSPEKTGYEGSFYFDPEDPIYADHFPGSPVVPGTLIIHAFTSVVSESSSATVQRGVKNFRFKHFVYPGRHYAYRIQPKVEGELACTLSDGQTVTVTGSIFI